MEHTQRRIRTLTTHLLQGPAPTPTPTPAAATPPLRVGLIGDSEHGKYGHGLQKLFIGRTDGVVVAIADPHAGPRGEIAAEVGGDPTQYDSYTTMLAEEQVDAAVIATSVTLDHYETVKACLEAGAHVFCEKPFVHDPAQADELLALAKEKGLKIAVKHEMQLTPNMQWLKEQLDAGVIGDLIQIDSYGKQDQRAGAEDMAVLAGHIFDLCRLFCGGDAQWASAHITKDGKPVSEQDATHTQANGDEEIVK